MSNPFGSKRAEIAILDHVVYKLLRFKSLLTNCTDKLGIT